MGKGGSKQAPTDSTVRQTNLPEYADPYFRRMLQGAEEALMPFTDDLSRPIYDAEGNITGFGQKSTYMPYQGERIAPSSMYGDIQASRAMTRGIAQSGIAGMPEAQEAARTGMGVQQEAIGGLRGLADYQPGEFSMAEFSAVDPTKYTGFREAEFDPYSRFRMANYSQFGFQQPERFTGSSVGQYMSPYMDAVVAEQKRGARQDFERSQAARDAAAVQAGAFGGSRQAVGQYLAEEGLGEQLGGIEAMGRQQAFEQAAQQFGLDRAARMEAEARQAGELGRVQAGRAGELAVSKQVKRVNWLAFNLDVQVRWVAYKVQKPPNRRVSMTSCVWKQLVCKQQGPQSWREFRRRQKALVSLAQVRGLQRIRQWAAERVT